jgi:hypothetical protein
MATVRQIADYREKYASHGGTVLPTAGSVNDPDGEALLVGAGKVLYTGFGWLAFILGISN